MWVFFVIMVLTEGFSVEPSPQFLTLAQCEEWVEVAKERGKDMKNLAVTNCVKIPGSSM